MSCITVEYTCKSCGLVRQRVQVPERAIAVDIALWMERVRFGITEDHAEKHPFCGATQFDLRIPVKEGVEVGRKVED